MKKFELSLDAKAHASFGQWDRANREIADFISQDRKETWEQAAKVAETFNYGQDASPLDSFEIRMGMNIAKAIRAKAQEIK